MTDKLLRAYGEIEDRFIEECLAETDSCIDGVLERDFGKIVRIITGRSEVVGMAPGSCCGAPGGTCPFYSVSGQCAVSSVGYFHCAVKWQRGDPETACTGSFRDGEVF